MKVVMRVDSSSKMGSGHLMRCITLAEELREEKKANVLFVCRDLPGNLSNIVERKGHQLKLISYDESRQELLGELSEHKQWLGATLSDDRDQTIELVKECGNVDLLVVDHYALDQAWETPMRQYVKKIMVIDDLADRRHDCDVLLDQNYYKNLDARYDDLVPHRCKKLLGPRYALLRREFYKYRLSVPRRLSKVKNILVNFGASDPKNFCLKLMRIISDNQHIFSKYNFTFITGPLSNCKKQVFELSESISFCNVAEKSNHFAKKMMENDLFIGAAGSTSWERVMLGIPALVVVVTENQRKLAEDGDNFFHHVVSMSDANITSKLLNFIANVDFINELAYSAFNLMLNKDELFPEILNV